MIVKRFAKEVFRPREIVPDWQIEIAFTVLTGVVITLGFYL